MTNLNISTENQRYNLKGTSFFETTDGTQYSISRKDSLELVSLLLEALAWTPTSATSCTSNWKKRSLPNSYKESEK